LGLLATSQQCCVPLNRVASVEVAMPSESSVLPSPGPVPVELREGSQSSPVAPPRLRVLVVDDNREAAEALSALLALLGHEVHTRHDGAQALAAGVALQPDMIFLDIGLPVLSGYEVARQLAEGARRCPLFMVAITGFGQVDDKHLAGVAGFQHHLVKPVMPAQLEALLVEAACHPRRYA